jgi:hypothetical protein
MKATRIAAALAAVSASFAFNAAAAEPPVAVNVENLQPSVAAQVQKHAQEGERALARYLERVRPYQRLAVEDVTRAKARSDYVASPQKREYRRHASQWHLTQPI